MSAGSTPLRLTLWSGRMEPSPARTPLHTLTGGLAQGDDAAWADFHRSFGPGIFRQLLAATRGDYDLASEALQQTYLRIARHARPCDAEPMFAAWLRVVTRSALNDCRRRRRTFHDLLRRRQDQPDDPVATEAAEDQLLSALDRVLHELDADDRMLLEAKYYSGTDIRALAARLRISEKAVESRLTRARAALRQRLLAEISRHE